MIVSTFGHSVLIYPSVPLKPIAIEALYRPSMCWDICCICIPVITELAVTTTIEEEARVPQSQHS